MIDVDRYLARVGLDHAPSTLVELVRAHVGAVPYENLDIHLGREIRIDVEGLVAKLVDARRGGYCYEQNTLFAAVLEELGWSVTRHIGRVRLGDAVSPRPATHMVLRVDDVFVDVGFGSSTPLAPIPAGGEVTVGGWTWATDRTTAPEGDEVWAVRCNGVLLYTFSDERRHPVDYVTPNHFSSTHPVSPFTQTITVQRSHEQVQRTLSGVVLTDRFPDGRLATTTFDPADLGDVLRDLGIDLSVEDLGAVQDVLRTLLPRDLR